jgi:GntR family transcriptional regulator
MIAATFFGVAVGSTEPIYYQLVRQIRRLIAGGQLKAGDKLPSVRDLAHHLTINPMTVSKAFGLLEAEALLIRQRGRVMVVADLHQGAKPIVARVGLLRPTLDAVVRESRDLRLPGDLVVGLLRTIFRER